MQDDRDHCAGSPCGNGAPCYTAQSDYYCHCAPGWTGKNCTQRAARDPPPPPPAECAHNPCRNNASCVPTAAGPACLCREGWTGECIKVKFVCESVCSYSMLML